MRPLILVSIAALLAGCSADVDISADAPAAIASSKGAAPPVSERGRSMNLDVSFIGGCDWDETKPSNYCGSSLPNFYNVSIDNNTTMSCAVGSACALIPHIKRLQSLVEVPEDATQAEAYGTHPGIPTAPQPARSSR